MVARRGWNLALSRQPLANCAQAIQSYRDELAKVGNPDGGGDAIMVRDIYVAETDEQAWSEAPPQITRFWQLATDNVWRGDSISTDDLPKFTERFAYFPGGLTVKRLDEVASARDRETSTGETYTVPAFLRSTSTRIVG